MDLGLSEEQEMLRNFARDFLEKECPETLVRAMEDDEKGYSPELWQKMAQQGWQGLIIPEKYGGTGMTFTDLIVLMEEFGRALVPGPFISTVVLGAMPILEAGTEAQKQEFLPKIAAGELIMTLALTEPSARWDADGVQLAAKAEGDSFVLSGTKLFVPDAHVDRLHAGGGAHEGERQPGGRRHPACWWTARARASSTRCSRPSARTSSARWRSTTCGCPRPTSWARWTRAGPSSRASSPRPR